MAGRGLAGRPSLQMVKVKESKSKKEKKRTGRTYRRDFSTLYSDPSVHQYSVRS